MVFAEDEVVVQEDSVEGVVVPVAVAGEVEAEAEAEPDGLAVVEEVVADTEKFRNISPFLPTR